MTAIPFARQGPAVSGLFFAALAAALLIAWSGTLAQTGPPVGTLVLGKGVVKVRDTTGAETVHQEIGKKIPVWEGNVVQSGRDTRAKISFRDEREVVSIYSNTHFKVTEVSPQRSGFGLSIGKAFFAALAGLRTNSFKVRTVNATIGIKGTEFVAGTDGEETFLLTLEGVVGLSNPLFPEIEVDVTANQASVVHPSDEPTEPQAVAAEQLDRIVNGDDNAPFLNLGLPPPSGDQGTGSDGEDTGDLADEVRDTVEERAGEARPSEDFGSSGPVDISITR